MVFVHGFPESWWAWKAQIAEFRDRYDVVAFDMRGYGESDKPSAVAAYRMRRLVGDLEAVVRDAAGGSPVTVVAHDWGANVAWQFARAHAALLRRLVILCVPHPLCFLKNVDLDQARRSWYVVGFQALHVPELGLGLDDFAIVDEMYRGSATGLRNAANFTQEDVVRRKQDLARRGARTGMLNYYRAMFLPDCEFDAALARTITVPTLLLWADHDAALGPQLLRGTEKYVPGVKIHILENCSHWAMQDKCVGVGDGGCVGVGMGVGVCEWGMVCCRPPAGPGAGRGGAQRVDGDDAIRWNWNDGREAPRSRSYGSVRREPVNCTHDQNPRPSTTLAPCRPDEVNDLIREFIK